MTSRRCILLGFALASALVVALATGCSPETPATTENPGPPPAAPTAELTSPESSVRSYIDAIGYAYRTARSEEATHAMTLSEWVRVDSYIELNRIDGRALEQTLTAFTIRAQSQEGTQAVLAAAEQWKYRYITMKTGVYDGPWSQASYETTYTLVNQAQGWLVDRVEAKALTSVE
ncbi:MAG: hypothetical protein Q8K99_07195 [Actinomycetota bacterium]|nr:hypothetical protein [Actinomycetota bacterium]